MSNVSFSSINDLKLFIRDSRYKKILIICGEFSFKRSGAEKIFSKVLGNKEIYFFYKKSSFPEYNELIRVINSIKKNSPDLILAIGGGSVIDYAKIANAFIEFDEIKSKIMKSSYNIIKKFAHLVAIPTTAGSGAEVTSNSVIYIDGVKYSVEGKKLKPDNFFLIPELVLSGSKKIKSAAGFDSIAQALESLISKKSNFQSLSFAKKSLEISLENFVDFVNKPNLSNCRAMCLASNLAGEAINISKTTAPHAVSYPFTSLYGISHGHAVSLTLNKFLKFNFNNIKKANCNFNLKKRFHIMFELSKTKDIKSFDKFIDNLKKKTNLKNNFVELGINIEKDYEKIISKVNSQRLLNNPVELKKEQLKEIIIS